MLAFLLAATVWTTRAGPSPSQRAGRASSLFEGGAAEAQSQAQPWPRLRAAATAVPDRPGAKAKATGGAVVVRVRRSFAAVALAVSAGHNLEDNLDVAPWHRLGGDLANLFPVLVSCP